MAIYKKKDKMSREEFYEKWDKEIEFSQSASNSLAILNHSARMLEDWHNTVWEEDGEQRCGDWNGLNCPHFRFFLYQVVYLTFGREMDWPEWHEEYKKIEDRVESRAKFTSEEEEQIRGMELARARVPSSAVELMGAFPNLNVGECPKCGASHAAESVCHACGYEYQDAPNFQPCSIPSDPEQRLDITCAHCGAPIDFRRGEVFLAEASYVCLLCKELADEV